MVSANEIPPGGEGKITVTVRAGYRRMQFRQVVQVRSNDPEHPAVRLTVLANVMVDLDHNPDILHFKNKEASPTVTITNYSDTPIELSTLQSSSEYVKLSLSSTTVTPQGNVVLSAELLPDVPPGVLSGWAKIHTNLKSFPLLQIRIWGNIQ